MVTAGAQEAVKEADDPRPAENVNRPVPEELIRFPVDKPAQCFWIAGVEHETEFPSFLLEP